MTLAVSVRLQYRKYSSMAVYWYRSVLLYFSMNGLISILLERIFYVNLDTFFWILHQFVWTTLSTGERWFVVGSVGMVSRLSAFKRAGRVWV